MQNQWLQTRRHFYEILKKQAQLILGDPGPTLAKYEHNYSKLFQRVWEVSGLDEVYDKLALAHLVIGGDFHPFSQSQRTHLRLLREIRQRSTRPVVLALEIFDVKDDAILQLFLSSKISFQDVCDEINWEHRWPGIPNVGYERLLNWARSHSVLVKGINDSRKKSLKERDVFSAAQIDHLCTQYPESLVYVIYGDYHLADEHLVAKLKSYNPIRDVRIFLNSEDLYFALAEHAVEDRFDVLKLEDRFCILSSPPWVKWQSYLLSLQEMEDEFIDDLDDARVDLTDYVAQILQIMVKDFGLPDLSSQLSVYSSSELDLEFLYQLELEEQDQAKLEYVIASGKNLVLPKWGVQYLGRATVNQAASLAGEILHAHLSHRQQIVWDAGLCFEAKVWIEAVSFFFSLTINPKRKALSDKDLRAQLEAQGEKEYAIEVLQLALDFRLSVIKKALTGEIRAPIITLKDWAVEMEASIILGEMMGQRLYEAYRGGRVTQEHLSHYFSLPVDSLKFMAMFDFLNAKLENRESLN